MTSINARANMIRHRIDTGLTVTTRIYAQLVKTAVLLNLALGYMDPKMYPSIVFATPYQWELVNEFSKIPEVELKAKVIKRLLRIGRVVATASAAQAAATALGYMVPIKPNGAPDFTFYLYPGYRNTVFIPLTGTRTGDEQAADLIRMAPRPFGYTWHHHEVVGIMQLVRTDVHALFSVGFQTGSHVGGAFYYTILKNRDQTYG